MEPTEQDEVSNLSETASRLLRLFESRIAPALERIAAALERSPGLPAADPRAEALAAIRKAIASGEWVTATEEIAAFSGRYPEDPVLPSLVEDAEKGRGEAIAGLKGRLDAARSVGDPGQVVSIRDELVPLIPAEERATLDRDVLQWLMLLLQRRMRTGTVRADVAELAAAMAERFADTKEGASLRAALPTLRRSAGLCGRCGQPYRGLRDACPRCTGQAEPDDDEDFLKSAIAPA